jgi:hypothetical protein
MEPRSSERGNVGMIFFYALLGLVDGARQPGPAPPWWDNAHAVFRHRADSVHCMHVGTHGESMHYSPSTRFSEHVMHFARCETYMEIEMERHLRTSRDPEHRDRLDSRVRGNDHHATSTFDQRSRVHNMLPDCP